MALGCADEERLRIRLADAARLGWWFGSTTAGSEGYF
uniref:Uncharacterized protein n=1 Tax=Cucumis melo TaxID=3656 RepID=A0A9I9E3W5_CUCME